MSNLTLSAQQIYYEESLLQDYFQSFARVIRRPEFKQISRSVDFAAQVIQYEVEEDQNQSQALSACDRAQYSTGLVRADARRLHWAYALRLVYNLAIYALTHLFRDFEHSRTLLWPSGTHSTSLDYQQVAGHWSPSTYRVSMPSVSHFVHEATLPAGYEEEELMLNSASDCIDRCDLARKMQARCKCTGGDLYKVLQAVARMARCLLGIAALARKCISGQALQYLAVLGRVARPH
ncbi:hypothetical protein EDD17DRAFT_1510190 [Pisolithus thermaeus]|nr:hypothetical protein EDD17DRAFT_1510190 [Pisolithus thermaeus]